VGPEWSGSGSLCRCLRFLLSQVLPSKLPFGRRLSLIPSGQHTRSLSAYLDLAPLSQPPHGSRVGLEKVQSRCEVGPKWVWSRSAADLKRVSSTSGANLDWVWSGVQSGCGVHPKWVWSGSREGPERVWCVCGVLLE